MEMQKKLLLLLFIKSCEMNDVDKVVAWLTLSDDLKVDINAANDSGTTAAQKAAQMGHTEIIKILAATGLVDWNKGKMKSGCTPLYLALCRGHFEVAKIIMEQNNINLSVQTKARGTIALAAIDGGIHCVQLLTALQDFDYWNIPDTSGITPLTLAIRNGHMAILEILLLCPRVNPNLEDNNGNSPVMIAVNDGKTAMARVLLKCPRVNLNTRDIRTLQKNARWE